MSPRTPRRLPPAAGKTGIERLEMQEFGRKIRHYLDERGMSQSDLARAVWGETKDKHGRPAAKNRDRISQYVAGKSWPEPQNLARIAEALGVAPDELAPDVTATTVDREDPAIQMIMVQGHIDKVYLRVNTLVSLSGAARVISILEADPVVKKTS
jgi:transcriptional regulator with XRE-family HTH domain